MALVASSVRGLSGGDFVARAHELAVISACAEAAMARRPGVVWVEGEAGSGKTALVRQAVKALPSGFSVLKGQADELATDIAYELAVQLGAVNCEGPFVAGMSLLEAWARAQDDGPVVIVVEDLHWADLSSSQALLSAVKRLERDRVLVVLTSRPGVGEGWERFVLDADRCQRLVLADFDVDEVAALAAAGGVELTHRQAVRLHTHTRGQPLYVRTLLSELSASQLRSADGDLPAPRSLASAVTARMSELAAPSARPGRGLGRYQPALRVADGGQGGRRRGPGRAVRIAARYRVRPLGPWRARAPGRIRPPAVPPGYLSGPFAHQTAGPAPGRSRGADPRYLAGPPGGRGGRDRRRPGR